MADEDFGATGGTTDTGLDYASGAGGRGRGGGGGGGDGGFDIAGWADDEGSVGRGGAGAGDADAAALLLQQGATIYSDFPSATGDVANEDVVLSLPAFANEENKALNERLIAKNRELAKASGETLEHQERIGVMQEHLKNIRIELSNAQKVLEARSKEVKSENHLTLLTERAAGRMKQDLQEVEGRGRSADDALASAQSAVARGSEKLEAFRAAMNWKQEELDKWAAAARSKEDDSNALDRYTRADELKVKELTRELERLAGGLLERKKELEADALDAAAKQVELDKLAADFRAAHQERARLLDQWQESLRAVEKRDADIARLAGTFADARLASAARRERIKDAEALLSRLESENDAMERGIESTNRSVSVARDAQISWTSRARELKERVDSLLFEVQGAASELLQKRAENDNFAAGAVEKEKLVEHAARAVADAKARRADAAAAFERVRQALERKEEFLGSEQARVAKAEKELAALREAQFKAAETVSKLREAEDNLHGELTGSKRTRRNLEDRLRELDAQATHQAEMVYAAEFQIQQMERKIGRAQGDVSEEEKIRLESRITELRRELEEAKATERQLNGEVLSVKQALQAALRRQAELSKELAEAQGTIDEQLLQTRSGEEALKAAVRAKEEALVSHDLLHLEVRRLRDALSAKTEGVYAAENRAAQITLSVEARKREVAAHRAVQRAQGKLAEEERHRIALDLTERAQRVSILKVKYESLCARLRSAGDGGDGDGDDGQPRSQAYYVLRAAQKREELQREGDELDGLCGKAEREVKALASTLGYLTDRNEAFRRAFGAAAEGGDEVGAVRALEARAKEAQDALFRSKRQLAGVSAGVADAAARAEEAALRAQALSEQLGSLETAAQRAAAERDQQAAQAAQMAQRVAAARDRHRVKKAARGGAAAAAAAARGGPTADELVFAAQGVREACASVLYTLGQLAREIPGLGPDLSALVASRGLRMPARPPSQAAGSGGGGGGGGGMGFGAGLASGGLAAAATAAVPSRSSGAAASSYSRGGLLPVPSPMAVGGGGGAVGGAGVAGSALHAIRHRPDSAGSARTAGSTKTADNGGSRGGGVVRGPAARAAAAAAAAGPGARGGGAQQKGAGLDLAMAGQALPPSGRGK